MVTISSFTYKLISQRTKNALDIFHKPIQQTLLQRGQKRGHYVKRVKTEEKLFCVASYFRILYYIRNLLFPAGSDEFTFLVAFYCSLKSSAN